MIERCSRISIFSLSVSAFGYFFARALAIFSKRSWQSDSYVERLSSSAICARDRRRSKMVSSATRVEVDISSSIFRGIMSPMILSLSDFSPLANFR